MINAQHQKSSTFQTNAVNRSRQQNFVANVNYKHAFNTSGKELTADIDYGEYVSSALSSTATRYYKLDGTLLQPDYVLNGDQAGKLKLRTAKVE